MKVVPWARAYAPRLERAARRGDSFSLLKNRWARIVHGGRVCFAQWEDSGPYVYDDAAYVFGHDDRRPRNRRARRAGMDVSPAVRDCLGFGGLDTDYEQGRLAVRRSRRGSRRPVETGRHHPSGLLALDAPRVRKSGSKAKGRICGPLLSGPVSDQGVFSAANWAGSGSSIGPSLGVPIRRWLPKGSRRPQSVP